MRNLTVTLGLVVAVLLVGCQSVDVGQPCSMACSPGQSATCSYLTGLDSQDVTSDYLETGKTVCENLVCIKSAKPAGSNVKNNPYCSKACVSDSDCSTGETGLVCRQVLPDQAFLTSLPADVRAQYLGGIGLTSYCAIPLSQP